MQQANFAPQVVDWFSEEYSPQFAQQTSPESNGDLVLMSATAAYEEASSNPGLQLMESWLNRVAPGCHQDIFAILAWSAGLAFEQAAKAGRPRPHPCPPDRQAPGSPTGPVAASRRRSNIGQKIPSKCFFYLKIENGAFQRVYPTRANTYDCNSGLSSTRRDSMHAFLEFTVIGIVLGLGLRRRGQRPGRHLLHVGHLQHRPRGHRHVHGLRLLAALGGLAHEPGAGACPHRLRARAAPRRGHRTGRDPVDGPDATWPPPWPSPSG